MESGEQIKELPKSEIQNKPSLKKDPRPATKFLDAGSKVKVWRKSSGEVEDGWVTGGVDLKTGRVPVWKQEGEKLLVKKLRLEEILARNAPEDPSLFSYARDFDGLYKMIDILGSVKGTQHTYEAEQLIELIEKLRKEGHASGKPMEQLFTITPVGGLRLRVLDLLNLEETRAELQEVNN